MPPPWDTNDLTDITSKFCETVKGKDSKTFINLL